MKKINLKGQAQIISQMLVVDPALFGELLNKVNEIVEFINTHEIREAGEFIVDRKVANIGNYQDDLIKEEDVIDKATLMKDRAEKLERAMQGEWVEEDVQTKKVDIPVDEAIEELDKAIGVGGVAFFDKDEMSNLLADFQVLQGLINQHVEPNLAGRMKGYTRKNISKITKKLNQYGKEKTKASQ